MNKKIIIPISGIIVMVVIAFSIIQIQINENQSTQYVETSDKINTLLEKIEQDKIENDNSENPFKPKPREWIRSGPFTIDRSEYVLGEKIFVNINDLNEKMKGEMVFAKIINSTHMFEYKKIKFDGSKPQQNFYLAFNLNLARGICTYDVFPGNWEVIFRGTNIPSLEFKVLDQIIPGMEENYKPIC